MNVRLVISDLIVRYNYYFIKLVIFVLFTIDIYELYKLIKLFKFDIYELYKLIKLFTIVIY